MYYVIMDLEWNSAYYKKVHRFVSEILEIGAVMLDENLAMVDTFSCLIKSQISDKLSGKTKDITHITNEDMYGGVPFSRAISDFGKWLGRRDIVFLTWGDCDIREMYENLNIFCDCTDIPFISKFVDMQKFCYDCLELKDGNQLGLSRAVGMLGIDTGEFSFHRALDDSLVEWRVFMKCVDKRNIEDYIITCDSGFFYKLFFKNHCIIDINDPLIDRSKMVCYCEKCRDKMKRISDWSIVKNCFRAVFVCKKCNNKVIFSVKFKEFYDHVETKTRQIAINSPQDRKNEE